MELELILTELRLLNLDILVAFLHCRIWSLCNQLLLQFSVAISQTLQTYYGYIGNVHVGFLWS